MAKFCSQFLKYLFSRLLDTCILTYIKIALVLRNVIYDSQNCFKVDDSSAIAIDVFADSILPPIGNIRNQWLEHVEIHMNKISHGNTGVIYRILTKIGLFGKAGE